MIDSATVLVPETEASGFLRGKGRLRAQFGAFLNIPSLADGGWELCHKRHIAVE